MRSLLLSFVIGLLCLCSSSRAEEERRDLTLRNLRWQAIASGVTVAYTAPDGKMFFQCVRPANLIPQGGIRTSILTDKLREQVVAEFKREQPQISIARLELFEPGGRVWFSDSHGRAICAYDGKDWITQPYQDRIYETINGRALSRGSLIDADANRYVNGACWFLTSIGVHRYDGTAWTFVKFHEGGAPAFNNRPRLAISADGKLAVAHLNRTPHLWIYSNGQWHKRQYFHEEQPMVKHLAVANSRDAWVQLANDDILHFQVNDAGEVTDLPAEKDGAVVFGDAQVLKARALYQDEQGRTFVAADSIKVGEAKPTAGLLILDAAGKTRMLAGQDIPLTWRKTAELGPAPLLTPSGDQVWLPNRTNRQTPLLMDLTSGKFVDKIPSSSIMAVQSVTTEGRVFSSQSLPSSSGYSIMVYDPRAPEPTSVAATRQDVRYYGTFTVSDDGSVWSLDPEGNLIRWNGTEWVKLKKLGTPVPQAFLAGKGGVMLIDRGGTAMLLQGEKEIAQGSFLRLVEEHRDLLVKAFGPGRYDRKAEPIGLAADAQGNLWCHDNGTLRVLVGNRWHETIEHLLTAGSRQGIVRYLAPLGDGRKMYLTDLSPRYEGGLGATGEIRDGKLVFEQAPLLGTQYNQPLGLRDSAGELWIRQNIYVSSTATSETINGQFATRLTASGPNVELKDQGVASLVDATDTVWLTQRRFPPTSTFTLWRKGEVLQTLDIPGFQTDKSTLISNALGSVFAMVNGGLQQLVAEGPDYKNYKLGEMLSLQSVEGETMQVSQTSRGELVLLTRVTALRQETYALWIVKLPGKP